MHVHHPELKPLIHDAYTLADIRTITSRLEAEGTFRFTPLDNGLFPAALSAGEQYNYTGYANVWVRDNVHIAHAHLVRGRTKVAVNNARALMKFFQKYRRRLDDVIASRADHADAMQRPHIRFNGHDFTELSEKWAHAQNDALGYFVWFYCRLAHEGLIEPEQGELDVLAAFVRYFETIHFWRDEDSGHWEEVRKVAASSVGIATAGLAMLEKLLSERNWFDRLAYGGMNVERDELDALIASGRKALETTLPAECVTGDHTQKREYDSALLFLIYPVEVVDDAMADRILADVHNKLRGDFGIRRYLGDSYWCADYKSALAPEERTADFSDDIGARDRLLKPGQEAQWCIFDSIVSAIYGRRYQRTGDAACLAKQIESLNRSLAQVTGPDCPQGEWRCPESYYLERGRYVPNDITPLLWTQANLWVALRQMERSLGG
jgi:hypothetical protein